jgi:hypothetical protein
MMASQQYQKRSRVKPIKTTVILDGNNTDDCKLTSKHLDMLSLSEDSLCG